MKIDRRTKLYKRTRKVIRGWSIVLLLLALFATMFGFVYAQAPSLEPVSPLGTPLVQIKGEGEAQASPEPLTVEEKIMWAWGKNVGPEALKVAFCESSLNPSAQHKHSSAKGLFQIISSTWRGYHCTGDPLNADDNIQCAYKLYQANGWGSSASWGASKKCHGLQ